MSLFFHEKTQTQKGQKREAKKVNLFFASLLLHLCSVHDCSFQFAENTSGLVAGGQFVAAIDCIKNEKDAERTDKDAERIGDPDGSH